MHNPAMLLRIEASPERLNDLLESTLTREHLEAHGDANEAPPLASQPVSKILAAIERLGWRVTRQNGAISLLVGHDLIDDEPDEAWPLLAVTLAILSAAAAEHGANGYAHVFNVPLDGFETVAYAHYRVVEAELTNDDFSQDEDEIREMDEAQAAEERIARDDGAAWPVDDDAAIVNAY